MLIVGGQNTFSNITITTAATNPFSGRWIVESGWLVGLTPGSLGTNSGIIVDPLYPMPYSYGRGVTSAKFEPCYDLTTSGSLILTNGGLIRLHQNCMFFAVRIEGTALTNGTYPYATLAGMFPASFDPGGSGGITVRTNQASLDVPTINVQPVSQTVFSGQSAQFTVSASGFPSPSYQWRAGPTGGSVYTNLSDSGAISGSITPTLSISNVGMENAADYLVLVTNAAGAVTSSVARLTVTQAAPILVTQPASQSLYGGQSAQFFVSATGSLPLACQWRAGTIGSGVHTNLSDGVQISGSSTTNLTVANVMPANAADYVVVVTNAFGALTSSVATLSVLPASAGLESAALRLTFNAAPFSFSVAEKSTGLGLLLQTANKFTFGGASYAVSAASNVVTTATTLEADLYFSGTSATAHIQFNFIQPTLLQVTLNSPNLPTAIFQQFADQGEEIFGGFECPTRGTLSTRNFSHQLPASFGVNSIVNACGAKAPFCLTTRHYGIYAETDALGTMTFAQRGYTSFSFNVPLLTFDIIYGSTYADVMAGFNSRSGGALMPPTWMFDSIWWKDDDHGNFHNAVTNAQGNVLATAIQLTNYQIHASAEWIDRPYGSSCGQGDGGWGNMDFDPANNGFNNPA